MEKYKVQFSKINISFDGLSAVFKCLNSGREFNFEYDAKKKKMKLGDVIEISSEDDKSFSFGKAILDFVPVSDENKISSEVALNIFKKRSAVNNKKITNIKKLIKECGELSRVEKDLLVKFLRD